MSGSSLFSSESVKLRVRSLYAEAVEAVKLQTALSTSSTDSIWIFGEIKSQIKLRNRRTLETVTVAIRHIDGPQYRGRQHFLPGNN
jgi:hypothetical protein